MGLILYLIVSGVFIIVLIGILLIIVVGVAGIVPKIIAAVRASEDEEFRYRVGKIGKQTTLKITMF